MTTKTESTVGGLLRQLLAKEITTEQMAEQLVSVKLPKLPAATETLAAIEASKDSDSEPEGGFSLISQAFTDGRITLAQYKVLATASASNNT